MKNVQRFHQFSNMLARLSLEVGGEKGLAIEGGHTATMALRFVLKVPKRSWQ